MLESGRRRVRFGGGLATAVLLGLLVVGCGGSAAPDPNGLDAVLDEENSTVADVERSLPGSINWLDGAPDLSPQVIKAVDCALAGRRLVGRLRAASSIASSPTVQFRYTSARGEKLAGAAQKTEDAETQRVEYVAVLAMVETEEELRDRFPGGTSREQCRAELANPR